MAFSLNWSRRKNIKRGVLNAVVFGTLTFLILIASSGVPSHILTFPIIPVRLSSAQVQRELGSRLSNTTSIIGPTTPNFVDAIARWSDYGRPKVQVVIEPGDEADVATIVSALPTLKW